MGTVYCVDRQRYALNAILAERERQEQLKAEGRFVYTCADVEMTTMACLAVLTEEVGEVARAVLSMKGLAKDEIELRKELIQVAAVALAWLEGMEK